MKAYNGMPAAELGSVKWLKSQYSNATGECVELAMLPDGEIAMRNSRFPGGPVLVYTQGEIRAFLAGAKDGEFDHVAVLRRFHVWIHRLDPRLDPRQDPLRIRSGAASLSSDA